MKKRLFLVLILFTLFVCTVGWYLVEKFAPSAISKWNFLAIPIFLAVYQAGVIGCIHRFVTTDSAQANNFMIISKVLKVLLSFVFILFNYWLMGLNVMNTPFLIAFILFYMAFIFFDSWALSYCNREAKRKFGENDENI